MKRRTTEGQAKNLNLKYNIIKEANLTRKEVEAVHDEEDANKTRQKTDASPCPMCGHKTAYFYEMQTRSADEPATIFFECEKCKHQWKEG